MTKIPNELNIYLKYLKRDVLTLSNFIIFSLSFLIFSYFGNWAHNNGFLDAKEIPNSIPNAWQYLPYLFLVLWTYIHFFDHYFNQKKITVNNLKSNPSKVVLNTNFSLFLTSNNLINKSLDSLELIDLHLVPEDTNDLIKILKNNSISNLNILNCTFNEKDIILLTPFIKNTKTLIKFSMNKQSSCFKQIKLNDFTLNSTSELRGVMKEIRTSLKAWQSFFFNSPFDLTKRPKKQENTKYKLRVNNSN
jgi:hypothetical protein